MPRVVRILLILVAVLGAAAGAVYWFGARATRQVPDFYATALEQARQAPVQASDQFEKTVLALRNDSQRTGDWQTILSAEQLNAWLTRDLPTKFPKTLPPEWRDLIVAISPDAVRLGGHFHDAHFDTILWLEFEPFLTDDPRELALQLRRARAGSLPLTSKRVVDELTVAARQAQLPLRWDQSGGDPIVRIRLSDIIPEWDGRRVRLTRIELLDGQLKILGTTNRNSP